MPATTSTSNFCPQCLLTPAPRHAATCPACDVPLLPLFDNAGALSAAFLAARGSCCSTGCRNCPYPRPAPRSIRCAACGTGLACAPGGGCWCEGVAVDPAALARLRERFEDCLCPRCLADAATDDVTTTGAPRR